MMAALPILPVLIPLLTAGLCLLAGRRAVVQVSVTVAGAFGLLVAAVVLFANVWHKGPALVHVGGWDAPIGIVFVADLFAAVMVLVSAVVHLAVSIYSLGSLGAAYIRRGYFVAMNILIVGVCGSFLTGDLFNLYVWFEVMLIGSFVLLIMDGDRAQLRAGVHYVAVSLLGSALFLAGVGVIYGLGKSLNMADLSQKLAAVHADRPWLVVAASVLLLVSFGIKAAVFPLYFWLPASYHTAPPAVSALFAGLLTKVGVYALIRVFGTVIPYSAYTFQVLLLIAGLTMIMGVLGAVSQGGFRKVLGFHIVSQIGYMVMGLALLSSDDPRIRELGVVAAVFYIIHHIIVKTNLFLVGGIVRQASGTEDLGRLGGMMTLKPWLAFLFLVPALSLAGLPPLSGFWAKLAVIRAGFGGGYYLLTATAIVAGLLTLVSMLKLWNEVFWKPAPAHADGLPDPASRDARVSRGKQACMISASAALAVLTVGIGLYPQPLFTVSQRVAESLLDRDAADGLTLVIPNRDDPGIHASEVSP